MADVINLSNSENDMRRDCMKCEFCWHETGADYPSGCGYHFDGSVQIGERCYKDGKLLKQYE